MTVLVQSSHSQWKHFLLSSSSSLAGTHNRIIALVDCGVSLGISLRHIVNLNSVGRLIFFQIFKKKSPLLQMFYIHVTHIISQITEAQIIHYLSKQIFPCVLCSLYISICLVSNYFSGWHWHIARFSPKIQSQRQLVHND